MRKKLVLSVLALAMLGGCARVSESRFNPLNWLGGGGGSSTARPADYVRPPETRPLVDQITSVSLEPTPGGAILTAVGLPPSTGYWDAALIPVEGAPENTLAFRFHLRPPAVTRAAGAPAARLVSVALHLTRRELEGVGTITVSAAQNALSAAR
ncbi:hypothetical protein [Profundibacterium mesophilum]|uniref:Prokaryotic membrane lipoprotein lipid attachment site domain containing protein n=1 Tax=Profundibacterium mesophilum KAUST100406-0324 TaxID=1037889 RepID=A0A921NXF7_9RHOB|nr:hypothetical protein [Profundibacterium mesophilum]KAF0677126.1 Prokaryotic membrane lipoprotein lipid attachment site domain containing protein [Profundibacterium mesophilum KAUST100406-0324]